MVDPGGSEGDLSLRRLLDGLDDAVFVLDAAWHVVYANAAANRLLGEETPDPAGALVVDLVGVDVWNRFQPYLTQVLDTNESTSFVGQTARSKRWLDYRVHLLDDRLVVVARDVTPVRESVQAQTRLLTKSRRENHFSEALNRLNRTVVTEPDMDSLLSRAVSEGMKALGVESGYIDVLDDGELVLRHGHGAVREASGRRLDPEAVPRLVKAADEREPVAIDDVRTCEDAGAQAFERYGIRSLLAVPLVVQGHILGFLSFATHEETHTWATEEVRFVRRIAVRASLALQNLHSQEELRASERRFRSTFDLAPVGIANQALDGRWLRVNARMCEILGRSRADLLAIGYRDVTHPDDYAEDERLFDALLAGGLPSYSMEKRFVLPDGSPKWGQVSRSLVRTRDGEPDYVVTIIEDIDARRRAEEQLARSRERERLLTGMLEDASQPFAVGEIGGGLIMCNDAFVELTGYAVTDLTEGQDPTWGPHIMPPEWEQIAESALLAQAEGEPVRFGRQYVRRDGTVVPVEVIAQLFVPEQGRPLVYAFVTDVTARVEAEDRARLAQTLNAVDEELGKQLSAGTSLPYILKTAGEALGAHCASVLSMETEGLRLEYGFHMPEKTVGALVGEEEAPFSRQALWEDRTVVVEQAHVLGEPDSLAARLGVGPLVAAPIRRGGQRHGVMVFCRTAGAAPFSDSEVGFITTVASHIALAVENARLYENEYQVAHTLQDALLRLPSKLPGVEFAHSYRSSSQIAKVGGDFYDVFDLDEHRIGVVVGDVAGKGLEAAALNARARATIRAEMGVTGRRPAEVLRQVNEVFARESEDDAFFTVFLGVLDRENGRLDYASGGHTTGAVISPAGTITRLPSTGPIVGAFSGLGFENATLQLDGGSTLFCYTDGLIEARSPEGFYGEERLFGSFERHAGSSPQELVDGVIADVLGYSDVLSDDVAVLAVRWPG